MDSGLATSSRHGITERGGRSDAFVNIVVSGILVVEVIPA
jgi:hypothetical protein